MRVALGWVAGIAVCAGIYLGLTMLLHNLGIPSYIDFDAPRTVTSGRAEWEIDGAHTAPGFAAVLLAFLLGIMSGVYVGGRTDRSEAGAKSNLQMWAMVIGCVIFGVITTALFLALGNTSGLLGFVHTLLELGAAAIGFLIARRWYAHARARRRGGG